MQLPYRAFYDRLSGSLWPPECLRDGTMHEFRRVDEVIAYRWSRQKSSSVVWRELNADHSNLYDSIVVKSHTRPTSTGLSLYAQWLIHSGLYLQKPYLSILVQR